MPSRVALYLDYENVSDVELVENCIDFAISQGEIVIQNAYTKQWKNSRTDGNFLRRLGFSLVNVILNIKNSVDCKCMFDCMDALQDKSSPDVFIFVTGDGDYAHLLNILNGHHKRTVVFARRGSGSKKLMRIAHEFYFLDEVFLCA